MGSRRRNGLKRRSRQNKYTDEPLVKAPRAFVSQNGSDKCPLLWSIVVGIERVRSLDLKNQNIEQVEKLETEPPQKACFSCKEGTRFGKRVYCSMDGRFHPLQDKVHCKYFVPK